MSATGLVGGVYMNALNMMIFPLVSCSVILGITGIGNIKTTGNVLGDLACCVVLKEKLKLKD